MRPVLVLLAGPNGAGKSTLYQTRVVPSFAGPFINADIIQRDELKDPSMQASCGASRIREPPWGKEGRADRKAKMARRRADMIHQIMRRLVRIRDRIAIGALEFRAMKKFARDIRQTCLRPLHRRGILQPFQG